jgi:branched-chain amino acid transport system substrate-binding protein
MEMKIKALAGILVMLTAGAFAQQPVLKIGVDGVMSGAAASWGLVNKYSAETTAAMVNAAGGWPIGGKKYQIEIVALDDKNDPQISASNAEKLVSQGIKYIIGPNVDTTAGALVPVMEKAKAINFPYAFSKELYTPPHGNSILGMIASYQAGPVIYKYLMEKKGVKKIAFLARNEADPLNQMKEGEAAAQALKLEIVSTGGTYEPGTTDFSSVIQPVLAKNPDLLVLSGVAPGDAALLIKAARENGYKGLLSTETAQDAKVLQQIAGPLADGFISVGGASTPSIQTPAMKEYIKQYTAHVGEWNDEAGTKVYALEILLRALQKAGPAALTDVEALKKVLPSFSAPNPFVKGNPPLKFVGTAYFTQPRQIGVPMVVNEFKGGDFQTLFVGSVE